MIYNLNGKLTYTDTSFAVVECGGVGFKCFVSMTTLKSLPSNGSNVNLFTYLAVREDAMDLYGFATSAELDAFKLLINVSGIGPKAAIAVLSVLSPDTLALAVSAGDVKSIQAAQGIGKKSAERIVLELKDKMTGIASPQAVSAVQNIGSADISTSAGEAVEVLVSLGFNRSDAAQAVAAMNQSLSADDMIRQGLKLLSSQL